jgi:hypothetical protein
MHIYIIYKIVNKVNGNFYIGTHKTKNINDGYMGSGVLIKRAVEKYGLDNFIKEILFVYTNKKEAFNKEKELVTITEVNNKKCYNLKEGGCGGFDHIREHCKTKKHFCFNSVKIHHPETMISKTIAQDQLSYFLSNGWIKGFSPEHKQKLSIGSKLKIQTNEHKKKNSDRKKHNLIYKKNNDLKWLLPEEVNDYTLNGWSIFTKNCKFCNTEFIAKGMSAKYCSIKCRNLKKIKF